MNSGTSSIFARRGFGIAAALLGLGLAFATPSSAEPRKLEADMSHARVGWSIVHGGFSTVHGIFRNITKAEITFDPDNVANSSVVASYFSTL